ncbi:pentatricopeptide repeat-containing protein [Citrus sinensis]|uniref:Pentatricopeptide repeat-containing protein n=1 Tax=Citrus sinensis TaxID=2711 RepID=A0ACB8LVC7_CITSI|nr:pentatricopeptide repeat-containing protein [Citrus sinensis]
MIGTLQEPSKITNQNPYAGRKIDILMEQYPYYQPSKIDSCCQLTAFPRLLVNTSYKSFAICAKLMPSHGAARLDSFLNTASSINHFLFVFNSKDSDFVPATLLFLLPSMRVLGLRDGRCSVKRRGRTLYLGIRFYRGCGINGKAVDAVKLFEAMVDSQIHTNPATYTGLLTAFNCAGVVEEGYKCFSSVKDHGLFPSSYQYGIMVDLLSRAGRLEEAYKQKKCMPMQSHVEKWGALFPASRLHNNIEYGDIADHHCFMLETDATAYRSLLANIYASAERWYDAWRLRKHMEENKLVKIPGCSWRELT